MADVSNSAGGFLSGFNATYFPAIRQNELLTRQKAQDDRANELQRFQMQKYTEAEAKDRQAAGLYAGMLGIKPTTVDDAQVNEMDPSRPDLIWKNGGNSSEYVDGLSKPNPQYEQFLAGGAKAGADMVKLTREEQLAALKVRTDAWKEQNAARLADLKDKQIMAIIAKSQGGGNSKPVLFMDEQNRPVYLRAGEDIPAGWKPYDKKAEGNAAKAEQAQQDKMSNASLVLEDIGRAKELADKPFSVGLGAETVARVPGTPASDLARMLDGIKANIGFDKLQAMRAASPTGGALGQVSDMENKLLQSTLGSLQQAQSPAQFKATLSRLESQYQDVVHGKGNRPGQPQGAPPIVQGQTRVRVFNPQTGRLE